MELIGIQFDYAAGTFWDQLAEAYIGTHDTLNSFIWYNNLGNGKKLDGKTIGKISDITNITNTPLATHISLSFLPPPEILHSVISLK